METTFNIAGLEKIIAALGKSPMARVGILGSSPRSDSDLTNAQVGACHEFGTSKLPERSFLRIPIQERMRPELEASGFFTSEALVNIAEAGSLVPVMQKVAILAEGIVADAFDTGGFGRWLPLSPKTLEKKRVHQILVETQQLRNSITSEVVE
jgi:hypothetical protein